MSGCHSEGCEFESRQKQIFFYIIENKVTESMTMVAPSGEQIKSFKSYLQPEAKTIREIELFLYFTTLKKNSWNTAGIIQFHKKMPHIISQREIPNNIVFRINIINVFTFNAFFEKSGH